MSKTVLAQVDGFTPIIDSLVEDVGIIAAAIFGRMWRFCQMENGVCHASIATIAAELHLSTRTVIRHSDNLVAKGYLKDLTPDLRNAPHIYADTGKAGLSISVIGMTKSHSGYDKKSQHAMTKSHMKKEYKKEEDTSAEKTPRQRDPLFDAIAEVCSADPATAGSSIAKVESALKKSEPPYTPEEVRAFGAKWWEWKDRTTPPTVWKLKEQIGIVRSNNGNGAHKEEQQPKPRKVYQ